MHLDDAAAVAKAMAGDEDAFRLLVERHSAQRLSAGLPHDGIARTTPKTWCRKHSCGRTGSSHDSSRDRTSARGCIASASTARSTTCAAGRSGKRRRRRKCWIDWRRRPRGRRPRIWCSPGEIGDRVQAALERAERAGAGGVSDAALPRLLDRRDLHGARLEDERGEARGVPGGEERCAWRSDRS